jgi:hypothetical protein
MELNDFFNSINKTKKDIVGTDEKAERVYVPYVINKSLSYHKDAIFHANFMNAMPILDKKMQYHYYLHGISKGSRYGKWHKDEDSRIEPIMAFYGYSRTRAKEVANILSDGQFEALKQALNRGGKP